MLRFPTCGTVQQMVQVVSGRPRLGYRQVAGDHFRPLSLKGVGLQQGGGGRLVAQARRLRYQLERLNEFCCKPRHSLQACQVVFWSVLQYRDLTCLHYLSSYKETRAAAAVVAKLVSSGLGLVGWLVESGLPPRKLCCRTHSGCCTFCAVTLLQRISRLFVIHCV